MRARLRERRFLLRCPGALALARAAGVDVRQRDCASSLFLPLAALREGAAREALVRSLIDGAAAGGSPPAEAPQRSYGCPPQALYGLHLGVEPPPGGSARFVSELLITDVSRLALPEASVRPRALDQLLAGADTDELQPFLAGPLRRADVPSRLPRACFLVAPDQVAPLYYLLLSLGMLRFDSLAFPVRDARGRPVFNGCFWTLKKGNRMRLLLDMRPGNGVGADPPDPRLSGPDSLPSALAYLEYRGVDTRHWSLCAEDTKNCFHGIAAGPVAEPYQCLPPISDAVRSRLLAMGVSPAVFSRGAVPVILTLAMGNKWSVAIAQAVLRNYVARTAKLLPHVVYSSLIILPYIDDLNVAGPTCSGFARLFMDRYRQLMMADGWALCDDKRLTDAVVGDVLGIGTDFEAGATALSLPRLAVLTSVVRGLLAAPLVSPRVVRDVVGSLVWALLVHRPLLSFFFFVFRWVSRWGRRGWDVPRRLARSVRAELLAIVDILPFAVFHFRAKPVASVISDACEDGGAAGFTSWLPSLAPDVLFLQRSRVEPGARPRMRFPQPPAEEISFVGWAFTDDPRWPMRLPGRGGSIAHKELFALLLSVILETRHSAVESRPPFSFVFAFNDNMTTVAIVQKGRSRSFLLNRTLRRLNAFCVLWGIRLVIDYVYSELNPADGPSRDAGLRRCFRFPSPYITSGTPDGAAAPGGGPML